MRNIIETIIKNDKKKKIHKSYGVVKSSETKRSGRWSMNTTITWYLCDANGFLRNFLWERLRTTNSETSVLGYKISYAYIYDLRIAIDTYRKKINIYICTECLSVKIIDKNGIFCFLPSGEYFCARSFGIFHLITIQLAFTTPYFHRTVVLKWKSTGFKSRYKIKNRLCSVVFQPVR